MKFFFLLDRKTSLTPSKVLVGTGRTFISKLKLCSVKFSTILWANHWISIFALFYITVSLIICPYTFKMFVPNFCRTFFTLPVLYQTCVHKHLLHVTGNCKFHIPPLFNHQIHSAGLHVRKRSKAINIYFCKAGRVNISLVSGLEVLQKFKMFHTLRDFCFPFFNVQECVFTWILLRHLKTSLIFKGFS